MTTIDRMVTRVRKCVGCGKEDAPANAIVKLQPARSFAESHKAFKSLVGCQRPHCQRRWRAWHEANAGNGLGACGKHAWGEAVRVAVVAVRDHQACAVVSCKICCECSTCLAPATLPAKPSHFEHMAFSAADSNGNVAAANQSDNAAAAVSGAAANKLVKRAMECVSKRTPTAQRRGKTARGFKGAKLAHGDASQGSEFRLSQRCRAMELSKGTQMERQR